MDKNYLTHLDGLRMISVISVIVFHLSDNFLPGGYIGVDIFFLISGYIITKLINQEINENKFNLLNFYNRRIKRIVPALSVAIITTLFFSYFILVPKSLINTSNSAISSILFFSNFYFWFTSIDYTREISLLDPLLHTWSLSVEGQFYILFPIFFYLIIKKFKTKTNSLILFVLIVSLLFATYASLYHRNANFYFTFSRSWEFLCGSVIALNINYLQSKFDNQKITNYLSNLSFIIIFLSLFLFNKNSLHPSIITLLPLLSAAFLIIKPNDTKLYQILINNRLSIYFGKISYSLYLWHFLILSLYRNLFGIDLTVFEMVFLFLIFLFISIISYHFIEQPFRKNIIINKNHVFVICLTFFLIICSASYSNLSNKGYENRLIISELHKEYILCGNECRQAKLEKNYLNKNLEKIDFLVIGNSHADDIYYSLKKAYPNKNIHKIISQIECVEAYLTGNKIRCWRSFSFNYHEKNFDKLKNLDIENIIVSSKWNSRNLSKLESMIDNLRNRINTKIIIFSPTPIFNFQKTEFKCSIENNLNFVNLSFCQSLISVDRYIFTKDKLLENKDIIFLEKDSYNIKINHKDLKKKLYKISADNHVLFMNLDDIYCEEELKKCKIIEDNKKLFIDARGHLSLEGQKYFGLKYKKKLENL
tara:strand:+ start:5828 stop:7774 length:1947 start_codon:yes stop_codon:yes gene_type:complete